MKDFILSMSIFISTIFFSVSTILGQSTEDTSGYHIIAAAYAVVCVITLLLSTSKGKFQTSNTFSIFIIAVIILSGLVSGETDNSYYQQFIVFSIPAALVGIHYGRNDCLNLMVKWLDLYCIVIAVSLLVSFPQYYASRILGDVYYDQTLSYEAAFAALLDLFLIVDTDRTRHFRFTNNIIYKTLSIVLIPILVLCIVLSGGRGGFITLIVGVILFLFTHKYSKKKILKGAFGITLIVIFLFPIILNLLGPNVTDFASESFGRIFSYISGGKIDVSQTSGRDEILKKAFELIGREPLSGYGFFSYTPFLGTYPHNIFVEWLLQGGILLFTFAMFVTIWFYAKLIRLVKYKTEVIVFLPIFIFPLTELLFSGTWVSNPYLWFCLFYVINYNNIIQVSHVWSYKKL